jgi:hypothetical protein
MQRRWYYPVLFTLFLAVLFAWSCGPDAGNNSLVDPDDAVSNTTPAKNDTSQEIGRSKPRQYPEFHDGLVGNLRRPPEIEFVGLQPGATDISGVANNVDVNVHQVVLWAKTNVWYVQPLSNDPYTPIEHNGTWSNWTHQWDRMVALVVDQDYEPTAQRFDHPASDIGVRAWTEYPEPSMRTVDFSGYIWRVKDFEDYPVGPGPNYFSAEESAVWVDNDGLHLRTEYRDGRWHSAEVELDYCLGYGYYTYKLASRVDSLDYHTTFSGFIYEGDPWEEIDIEWSQVLAGPGNNMQYVVQPWYEPENIVQFSMTNDEFSTHRFEWREDRIEIVSWRGHSDHPVPGSIINHWVYPGDDIPIPDDEDMHFNLWFYLGYPPVSGQPDEVVVQSFHFQP